MAAVAMDLNNPDYARCTALRILAWFKELSKEVLAGIQALVEESGRPAIFAAAVLSKHGMYEPVVIERLADGIASDEIGIKRRVHQIPADNVIPVFIDKLRVAEDSGKSELAYCLSEVGFNSTVAAQAIVNEFAAAQDDNLRNMLWNAVRNFEELAFEPALVALEHCKNDEQIIRLMSCFEGIEMPEQRQIPALAKLLPHPNRDVGFYAARALSYFEPNHTGIVPHFLNALSSSVKRRRYEAIRRIEWMGNAAAPFVPRMIELLDDPEFEEAAAHLLGWIGPVGAPAIPALVKIMHGTNESHTAIESLGRIGHSDAVPHLIAALDNEQKIVSVLDALRYLRTTATSFIPKLVSMLAGPYQLNVLQCLENLGPVASAAGPAVENLLDEKNAAVRSAAIKTLGRLELAGERLLALARADEPKVRDAALRALGGPRPRNAIPLLLESAASDETGRMQAATDALACYGSEVPGEFVSLLMRRFEEDDESAKWAAIQAFEKLGPVAFPALPIVSELLTDKVNGFSESAFNVIRAMGSAARPAIPQLEALLTVYEFRTQARSAIREIAPDRLCVKPRLGDAAVRLRPQ